MPLQFLDDLEASMKQLIAVFSILRTKVEEDSVCKDNFKKLERDCRLGNDLIKGLISTCVSSWAPPVSWHPTEKDKLDVSYLFGDSPWDFTLSYGLTSEIDKVLGDIEKKWCSGSLTPVENLVEGSYVCCCHPNNCFRGLVTGIVPSKELAMVLNVDDMKDVAVVKIESCYNLMPEFTEPHANNIQCCLVTDQFNKSKWTTPLSTLFRKTLYSTKLTIKIIDSLETMPPKFIVELHAFNAESKVETDIGLWITSKLLPAVETLEKDITGLTELYTLLDENILNPFNSRDEATISQSPSQQNRFTSTDIKLEIKTPETTIKQSLNCNGVESGSPTSKPHNRVAHFINTESSKFESSQKLSLDSAVDVPEFVPGVKFTNHKIPAIKDSDASMFNAEDLVIPGNYIPTDNDKLCPFLLRDGNCWKTTCQKVHEIPAIPDKLTDDTESVFVANSIYALHLPTAGSKTSISVTHVKSPNMFYAILNDPEEEEGENIITLINALNDSVVIKDFKTLSTPPCFGQLLIAYSDSRRKWLRAAVIDIFDTSEMLIFFVDLGISEAVLVEKCREILPEFIHIPYQAILCSLYDLSPDPSKESEGSNFLESLITDRDIDVTVVNSYEDDTRMEVIAYSPETGESINELVVKHGYCTKFKH